VRLEVALQQEPHRLVVEYGLTNTRAAAVLAFDVLQRIAPGGVAVPGPALAYVMAAGHGTATVGKYLMPIPPGKRVATPAIPLLSRIEPGATHQGRAVLALPLIRSGAFAEPARAVPPRPIAQLRFVVGFLDTARMPGGEAAFTPALAPCDMLHRVSYATGIDLQEFAEAPLQLDPPVQGRL
jgi:hypothetical protein